jgi:hypothetical protein
MATVLWRAETEAELATESKRLLATTYFGLGIFVRNRTVVVTPQTALKLHLNRAR